MPTKKKSSKKRPKPKAATSSKIERAEAKIFDVGEEFQHLKALLYGRNGTGKTRRAATGPKPIVIDCNEKGTLSIRRFPDTKVFKIERWSDIDLAYWYLHAGNHDRETAVIDNITSLATLCMKFVLGDESSRDPTKDPDMPSKREWGKVGELMKTQILQFRNLPMHVIFLAQERRGFTEDDEEAPEVFPEVSPSIRSTLTASVDIIGRTYTKEVVRKDPKTKKKKRAADYRVLIGPSETYVTKDRSDSGLPRVLNSDFTIQQIIDKIKEG